MVTLPNTDDWNRAFDDLAEAFSAHADAETGPPAQLPAPAAQAPPPAASEPPPPAFQPPPDPGRVELEELRRREHRRDAIEPPPPSNVGTSFLAEELERSGFFARHEMEHAADREHAREEAARQSRQRAERGLFGAARDVVTEAPTWLRAAGTVTPGGIVTGFGTAMREPDVLVARAEYSAQDARLRLLQAMEAIDEGAGLDTVMHTIASPIERRSQHFIATLAAYARSTSPARAAERARVEAAFNAFAPTPIAERTLTRGGAAVEEFGRTLHARVGIALPEGYTEDSFAVQFGRGLGSMASGLAVRQILGGPAAAGFFMAMGSGEASSRAIEFDRAERAAGRPGLTQEQIITAGLLGIGPGSTDIIAIEAMLRNLPLRMPGPLRTAIARSIGRVGGQAFIEAVQEGGQEFLQNFIAAHAYNPNQDLLQGVIPSAQVGGAVGGTVQGLLEVFGGMRRGRRGGSRTGTEGTAPPPQQEDPFVGWRTEAEARAANCGNAWVATSGKGRRG